MGEINKVPLINKVYSKLVWRLQELYNLPLDVRIQILKKSLRKSVTERTSFSDDVEGYRAICKLAVEDESIFKVFKRSSDYRGIVENVTRNIGQECLNIIKKEGKDLLEYFPRFQKNDLFGNPITFKYDVGRFSPTTLRYIKILAELRNIFSNLNNFNIVEIGCGYGGQCKIISDVISYKSYAIVDLGYVIPLIKKYLSKFDIENISYIELNQINNDDNFDLVISNYAFSECKKTVQDEYIKKFLNKSRRGYITYNYDRESGSNFPYSKKEAIERLSGMHDIMVMEERPKTGAHNCIITWDDRK